MVGTYLTLKETLSTLTGIYDRIEKGTIGDNIRNRDVALFQANGSIIKLLSNFIIEPTIIVSKEIREEEISEKVAEINVEIFSSYYLQAFNVLTNIYGFRTEVAFDLLSSKGAYLNSTKAPQEAKFGFEEYGETLDILPIKKESKDYIQNTYSREVFGMPAKKTSSTISNAANNNNNNATNSSTTNAILAKKRPQKIRGRNTDSAKEQYIFSNLIQKEMDIVQTIVTKDGGASYEIVIPITIKANVIYSDFANIENMVSTNGRDRKMASRLDDYRSGLISINDFIFAGDLIKKYKGNKIKDKDDLITQMETRATKANSKALTKGYVGLSKFYSTLIITKNQLSIIENKLGGKISKPKYKEMLMDQTKSMLISIVDTDYERVELHTKDLNGTSDVSYKVLNKKKKDSDTDMADLFKSLISNSQPRF